MAVYCLPGKPALSPFRFERLQQRLQQAGFAQQLLGCVQVYLVATDGEPPADGWRRLNRLLAVVDNALAGEDDVQVLVGPRIGTISPWSSKATDIAHRCGFDFVERIEQGRVYCLNAELGDAIGLALLNDRMTESVLAAGAEQLFARRPADQLVYIPLLAQGSGAIDQADADLGLALSRDERAYLTDQFQTLGRDPTDAELMMFAQANSEHCRHKIFNARWTIDGREQQRSLFDWIRHTHACQPQGVLSAYSDNAAVITGAPLRRLMADPDTRRYRAVSEEGALMIKVETHNHPTAIAPFPGAATGSGGEIRDEAATGRGAKPKAGLTGFSVSNLHLPGHRRPWEEDHGRPARIASALDIMIAGPIGAAAFNNEFGRPALGGYFRSYEQKIPGEQALRGYHKPIMIAGGMGSIRPQAVHKCRLQADDRILVLGGPAMLIGLGGGAASSMASGASCADLDFASVQRGNPEMQRRCQEVIDRCWARGDDNPIVSIHDVGAGGLANAIPELLHDSDLGGTIDLRAINNADASMSPMQIWCNEAQERYVLALRPSHVEAFVDLCRSERCPVAVVGTATAQPQLRLYDEASDQWAVDMPMDVLFGKAPKLSRHVHRRPYHLHPFSEAKDLPLSEVLERVLRLPAVGGKAFLITIGDRTVGGLVSRDPMVGPRQVPVADAAVTCADFYGYAGEAMAMGERAPLALLDAPASGRMAVAEAITNLASAPIAELSDIKLSANWMAAAGVESEDAALYATVRALGEEFCPALGVAIPVGKDSLSMQTVWSNDAGEERRMLAPLSLIISAFAPVRDVRAALTPQLCHRPSRLILLDLGRGQDRLGGSALAQVYNQLGDRAPDCDSAEDLRRFFALIQQLNREGQLLAYHDRSDGGVLVTALEMAFAGDIGIELSVPKERALIPFLLAEELGAVLQVADENVEAVCHALSEAGFDDATVILGGLREDRQLRIHHRDECRYQGDVRALQQAWSETSYLIQRQRDNPATADEEFASILDSPANLQPHLSFDPADKVEAPMLATGAAPEVAILREQGVNGQIEMAAAFSRAGFDAVDVHMNDLIDGSQRLARFTGLAACGGFSYGDVLGAGQGWARAILFRDELRQQFAEFFADPSRFGLGVCNGCQALAALAELIPGSDGWPRFLPNRSEQYEARLSLVEVLPSPSIFLAGMVGSRLPIAVAHGEGRAVFDEGLDPLGQAALRFVDGRGRATETYPANPNGSPQGVTGWCNTDGRVSIMMPHPERVFRRCQHSWAPPDWPEDGPWLRLFRNARLWVAGHG